jgi:hypothetical protein
LVSLLLLLPLSQLREQLKVSWLGAGVYSGDQTVRLWQAGKT